MRLRRLLLRINKNSWTAESRLRSDAVVWLAVGLPRLLFLAFQVGFVPTGFQFLAMHHLPLDMLSAQLNQIPGFQTVVAGTGEQQPVAELHTIDGGIVGVHSIDLEEPAWSGELHIANAAVTAANQQLGCRMGGLVLPDGVGPSVANTDDLPMASPSIWKLEHFNLAVVGE
jgi:hypothetical protein